MNTYDKIFFGIIFGAVLPVTLFLAGWWSTIGFVPENQIFIYALAGILLGIIIDFFFIKKVLLNLFNLKNFVLILIYFFYSICCFGFFMGVPLFNTLLGIIAGYYIAVKYVFIKAEKNIAEKYFNQTALFSAIIMIFVSAASATFALSDPYTSRGLKEMLGLNFEITKTLFVFVIIIGGLFLICFQYLITKLTAKIIYNRLMKVKHADNSAGLITLAKSSAVDNCKHEED